MEPDVGLPYRLAVLITSHNRKFLTLRCIESLYASAEGQDLVVDVFLAEDGSTDGTSEAVVTKFPSATVIQGNGEWFWARGMEIAWRRAAKYDFDAYLWLNDDVQLAVDALPKLVSTARQLCQTRPEGVIVAGSLTDPETGNFVYGVCEPVTKWHPTNGKRIEPDPLQPVQAKAFYGNVVLVTREAFSTIGFIEGRYAHAMADADYWLRALESGVEVWTPPGSCGTCLANPMTDTSLKARLGRKGTPLRDWLYFTWRFSPKWSWPIVFLSPYIGGVVETFLLRRRRTSRGITVKSS